MATIRVAIDKIGNESSDLQVLNTFASKLRSAGHTVTTHGRGPNKIQRVMLNKSNQCDMMIQIAGGKCLGTLVDFYTGINRGYYYAKGGGFAYYKCWDSDWKAKRAHDDGFSSSSSLAPYVGKTLPEIYQTMSKLYYGYGTTAEAIATTWLQNYSGTTTTSSDTGQSGGTSILELIKQVCSDWDPLGVELLLDGDTLTVQRTNPTKHVVLDESMIITNSVNITDYDSTTPNVYKNAHDDYLISRFGKIPLDGVDSSWESQVLQVAQRGHGFSIDLKCILDDRLIAGNWVKLNLPSLGLVNRMMYISKSSYEEDVTLGLTLESAPPSIYVEQQAEESTEETETTEE